MAEIAIPIVALGAMWLINKDKKKKHGKNEGFDNVSAHHQRQLDPGHVKSHLPVNPPVNYPKPTYSELTNNTKYYPAPNAATDRYYQQSVYEKKVEDGGDPTNASQFQSLTGSDVQKCDIKHNNMVPFFGSKVTQRTTGFNGNEGLLDKMQGSGSQHVRKKAQAPLFAPQKNMNWAHGAPNSSDFIQSRMNPSRNISNNKPWEEIQVGPGLNKGFSSEGSNGFNAGMEAREQWQPKTVDELRTKTNPKVTFGLANHEGPAQGMFVRGHEGRVEKNRPDTFYMNSPDRWFTTTGQEKGPTNRSAQVMQPIKSNVGREYFGNGNGNKDGGSLAGPAEQNFRKSRRPVLPAFDKYKGPAYNRTYKAGGDGTKDDYGRDGMQVLPNSRTTTRQADEFGIAGGWLRAITAPILDALRPSRKENVIGNIRPNGNAGGSYGVNEARVWNPADRTKTTIKEQTIDNIRPNGNPGGNFGVNDGGYLSADYQPVCNQRDTTTCSYTGDAGATPWSTAGPVYNAAYNANLNPNKEILEAAQGKFKNAGSMSLFNDTQNTTVGKIGSIQPDQLIPNMPKQTGNISTHGSMSDRNIREYSQDCVRNTPDTLSAFNDNPYTQSLYSVA
jgi:hypothetical protein